MPRLEAESRREEQTISAADIEPATATMTARSAATPAPNAAAMGCFSPAILLVAGITPFQPWE